MTESNFISYIKSTDEKTIVDSYKSNQFEIPSYQRPYAWGATQIRNLFFDYVEACKKDTKHFIGSILLYRADSDKNKPYIIDGQQRTISCLLMCIALVFYVNIKYKNVTYDTNQIPSKRRRFGTDYIGELKTLLQQYCDEAFSFSHKKNSEKENYKSLHDFVEKINSQLEDPNDNLQETIKEIESELKIKKSEQNNYINNLRIFYKLISDFVETSTEDFALLQAYKHDKNSLNIKRINVLCGEIKRINCVEIIINNSDYAHEIFEVINTQGVNLNNYELIRSFLIFQDDPRLKEIINRIEEEITRLAEADAKNKQNTYKKRIKNNVISDLTEFYLSFAYAFCLDCGCPLIDVNRQPNIPKMNEIKVANTQNPEYQKFKLVFNKYMSDCLDDVITAMEIYCEYYKFIKYGNSYHKISEKLANRLDSSELKLVTDIFKMLGSFKSAYIPELMFLLRRFLANNNQQDYLIDKKIFLLLVHYIFSQIIFQPSKFSKIKFLHKPTNELIESAQEFFGPEKQYAYSKDNFINSLFDPEKDQIIHLLNIYHNHPDSYENRIQTSTSKEHIIPLTPTKEWQEALEKSLNNNPELARIFLKTVNDINNITDAEHKQIYNNATKALGNLVLLELDYNSKLQNKDWEIKKNVYQKSNFEEVTRKMKLKDGFSLEDVIEQTQKYGERIYNYCSSDNPVMKPIIDELNKEGFQIKY